MEAILEFSINKLQTAIKYFLVILAQSKSFICRLSLLVKCRLLLTHKMLIPTIIIPRRAQSHLSKNKKAPSMNDCSFFFPSPNFQWKSKPLLVTAKGETQRLF